MNRSIAIALVEDLIEAAVTYETADLRSVDDAQDAYLIARAKVIEALERSTTE